MLMTEDLNIENITATSWGNILLQHHREILADGTKSDINLEASFYCIRA